MDPSTLLVYATVWSALICYLAGPIGATSGFASHRRLARGVWTIGALLFSVHAIGAFALIYNWSASFAWSETARRSEQVAGFDSGVGLVFNLLFTLVWVGDAVLWWTNPKAYGARRRRAVLLLHGFFLFMIVNGAVIFVPGPQRILGLTIVVLSFAVLWHGRTKFR